MVLPFLAVYSKTIMGFDFEEVGVLASAFGIGSLGGALLGGSLTDRYGPRFVIICSLLLGGTCFILLQWAQTFNSLFVMILIASLFGEAYRPAMNAAAGQFVEKHQTGRTMALIRLAINVGMTLAPVVGGLVATSLGYKWLFWIDGLTCISAALYFFLNSKSWPKSHQHVKIATQASSLHPLRNTRYLWFLVGTFLFCFVFLQWFHTVPVFIKDFWGFDERYIGLLLGVASMMVAVLEMPWIHSIELKGQKLGAILWGCLLVGLSYLIFLGPQSIWICFGAVFFWTLGEILFLPLNNAAALDQSPPDRRGQYMSGYFMTWSLANILTPLLGFKIISTAGYSFFWVVLAACGILSFVINKLSRTSEDS